LIFFKFKKKKNCIIKLPVTKKRNKIRTIIYQVLFFQDEYPTYGELGQEIVKLQEKIQDIQNKISVERKCKSPRVER